MVYMHRSDDLEFGMHVRDTFAALAAEAPDSYGDIRKTLAAFVDAFDATPGDQALSKAWGRTMPGGESAGTRAKAALASEYRSKAASASEPSVRHAFDWLADQLAQ